MGFYDAFFVHRGFAVLSFDKRGAGRSTGDWRTASLEDLAADVAAGADHLRSRPDIDPRRVGLHGGSQGGWVGSLAAARDPRTVFLAITCGSGVTVAENVAFEGEGRLRQAGFRGAELQEAVAFAREIGRLATQGTAWDELDRRFQAVKGRAWSEHVFPAGLPQDSPWWTWYRLNGAVDATVALRSVRCPVAWFLADRDWNVPPARSGQRLRAALAGRGQVRTFGPASHMMMEARTGHDDERASMRRFTPGYWEALGRFVAPFSASAAPADPRGDGDGASPGRRTTPRR
jgi:pimeloyl-ACP methyl ester carboxylesterase